MDHGDSQATCMPCVPAAACARRDRASYQALLAEARIGALAQGDRGCRCQPSVRGERRRRLGGDVEGAEMEFLPDGFVRLGVLREQRERGLRVLLPDLEIAGGDGEPAERVHVASGLGNPADPVPGDLVDCHSVPRSQICK
ncbi:hypothetical protein DXU04_36585 [Bradyrhizobium diazoefficiens]